MMTQNLSFSSLLFPNYILYTFLFESLSLHTFLFINIASFFLLHTQNNQINFFRFFKLKTIVFQETACERKREIAFMTGFGFMLSCIGYQCLNNQARN